MFLTCGSTSQPWYRGMPSRSKILHSGVYSKSETPVNRTLTSRPVASRGSTVMASSTFWEERKGKAWLHGLPSPNRFFPPQEIIIKNPAACLPRFSLDKPSLDSPALTHLYLTQASACDAQRKQSTAQGAGWGSRRLSSSGGSLPSCPLSHLLKIKLKSLRFLLGFDGQEAVSCKTGTLVSLLAHSPSISAPLSVGEGKSHPRDGETLQSKADPSFLRGRNGLTKVKACSPPSPRTKATHTKAKGRTGVAMENF